MFQLEAEVQEIGDCEPALGDAMFQLYGRYYDATSRERFLTDLRDKDRVVLLRDGSGCLRGFSTLAVLETVFDGTRVRVIFSGDTIADHRYWGQQTLAFAWIRLAGRIKAQVPQAPLFWFLIVKGHRTYRYLEAFSRDYHPHWQRLTPPGAQALMDHLARLRFGACYDAQQGVVRFASSRGHLKPQWAGVSTDERRRPAVAYFLARNPGYVHGEELVCLAELHPDNLRPLARRLFLQGMAP